MVELLGYAKTNIGICPVISITDGERNVGDLAYEVRTLFSALFPNLTTPNVSSLESYGLTRKKYAVASTLVSDGGTFKAVPGSSPLTVNGINTNILLGSPFYAFNDDTTYVKWSFTSYGVDRDNGENGFYAYATGNTEDSFRSSELYDKIIDPRYSLIIIVENDTSKFAGLNREDGSIYSPLYGFQLTKTYLEYFTADELAKYQTVEETEPYYPGGTSNIGGGGGNFGQGVPNDNVTVDIPSGSNFGYVGGSMFTHYALSGNQVELFGEWLWTEDLGLSLWKTAMEKIFNETADALIGLMAFPFNISTLPNVSLVDGTIKAGNLPTGIPARILQSPYTQVDWGTIQLTEYWGNFLDYAPHTKIELYLPWSTGFVPIDPHQCLPGSLSVKTNIDLQKGTCTHNVLAGTTVLGVYEGQVGYEIPLLASNFSAKLAGATVAAVSTAVSGLAAGSAAVSSAVKISNAINTTNKEIGALAYSRSGILNANPMAYVTSEEMMAISRFNAPNRSAEVNTFNAVSRGLPSQIASKSSVATAKQPVNVSRNGSFSGSSAGLSIPYPYVIISRPEQNIPVGYGHFNGYPSNVGVSNMLQLKGYTEIGAIHLNGIRAVPDELAELDDILKGGFII